MEIVDFSQVLQQSSGGRSLGDEILAAVVRSGIVAASLVQRDVRADANTVPGAGDRWFVQPGNDHFAVGISDEDAVALTEVLFGAPAVRSTRPLAPIERRVLGTHLAVFLAPVAHAVHRPIDVDTPLVEGDAPDDGADWLRFGITFAVDDTTISCTVAARELRAAGATAGAPTGPPPVEDIVVEAEVALRGIRISWGDLANLRVGDVVSCGLTEDQPIRAWVDGRLAYAGHVTATDDGLDYEIETTYLERVA